MTSISQSNHDLNWPNWRKEGDCPAMYNQSYCGRWQVKSHLKKTQPLWLKLENTAQDTHTKSTLVSRMVRTISQACYPMLQTSC